MNVFLDPDYWEQTNYRDVERDIEEGYDLNEKGYQGMTPLMYACNFNEDASVVRLLLDEGAEVNAKNKEGKTALMFVAQNSDSPELLEVLINEGAKINIKDKAGWTPLMAAAKFNDDPEIIKILVEEGADINTQDKYRKTAWDYIQYNKKLSKKKRIVALLEPTRRDSYRGFGGRTRLDRTRRRYR